MTDCEPKHVTASLKFADEHVEPILKGQKTATIRLDIDYEAFQIGKRFHLCDESGERFATAVVDDRGYDTIEWLAKTVIEGHREYRSTDDLLDELREYYPDQTLDGTTLVEVIYWDYEDLQE